MFIEKSLAIVWAVKDKTDNISFCYSKVKFGELTSL
jgi:hypothetical protein